MSFKFWKRPICWKVGHDVIAGDNLFWWDCQRCGKNGAGDEAVEMAKKRMVKP